MKQLPSYQHLIQNREVITTSEAKHTEVSAINKDLKKRVIQKNLVTTPEKMIVKTQQKTFQIQTKKLMNKC